jgi:hypothetical protein
MGEILVSEEPGHCEGDESTGHKAAAKKKFTRGGWKESRSKKGAGLLMSP